MDMAEFHDPWSLFVMALAAMIVGLAKGGLSGVGVMAVPVLALVLPPVQAAAILLPILIVQDVVSVWAFRRDWDCTRLTRSVLRPGRRSVPRALTALTTTIRPASAQTRPVSR